MKAERPALAVTNQRNTVNYPKECAGQAMAQGGAIRGGESLVGEQLTQRAECAQGVLRSQAPTIRATVEVEATHSSHYALRAVLQGQRITRAGWNGPNQYVQAQYPDKNSKMTQPYLVLKNAQNDLVPWVPSQGDLFACDWAILP